MGLLKGGQLALRVCQLAVRLANPSLRVPQLALEASDVGGAKIQPGLGSLPLLTVELEQEDIGSQGSGQGDGQGQDQTIEQKTAR